MKLRTSCVLLAGALIVLLPAGQASAAARLQPILECVNENSDGTFTALWGYEQDGTTPMTVVIGNDNRFQPKPADRGQPTTFDPGRHEGVFTVNFDGSKLTWFLDSRHVDADRDSTRCTPPPVVSEVSVAVALPLTIAGVIGLYIWSRRRRPTRQP